MWQDLAKVRRAAEARASPRAAEAHRRAPNLQLVQGGRRGVKVAFDQLARLRGSPPARSQARRRCSARASPVAPPAPPRAAASATPAPRARTAPRSCCNPRPPQRRGPARVCGEGRAFLRPMQASERHSGISRNGPSSCVRKRRTRAGGALSCNRVGGGGISTQRRGPRPSAAWPQAAQRCQRQASRDRCASRPWRTAHRRSAARRTCARPLVPAPALEPAPATQQQRRGTCSPCGRWRIQHAWTRRQPRRASPRRHRGTCAKRAAER
jgi:hypothetical protein